MPADSAFVASTLVVGHNAVKSLLFRAAELLMTIAVTKVFALIAFKGQSFSSYLMFTEDYYQKTLFVISRRSFKASAIVLGFTAFAFVAGLYSTLLWGLDRPGYHGVKRNVTAASLEKDLLQQPSYVVYTNGDRGNISALATNMADTFGANLFRNGLNFTITGTFDQGQPNPISPKMSLQDAQSVRVWLDADGFSVSPDSATGIIVQSDGSAFNCPITTSEKTNTVAYSCTYNNSFASAQLRETYGRPEIHWDDESDSVSASKYLNPARGSDPWFSLGPGGGTYLWKVVFTVARNNTKHTFLHTAFKTSIHTVAGVPFALEEVTNLIRRTWSTNPADLGDPAIGRIANRVMDAYNQNVSYMFSGSTGNGFSVAQSNYDLMTPTGYNGTDILSIFRIGFTNTTLIRSDPLDDKIVPYELCPDTYYQNVGVGGKITGTDCFRGDGQELAQSDLAFPQPPSPHFLGEIDTLAVFVMQGILGDSTSNISSVALDQTAQDWTNNAATQMDNLLLSRGLINVDARLVMLEIEVVKPAMSWLQVVLVLAAALCCALCWSITARLADPHYSASLIQNLLTTTGLTERKKSDEEERNKGSLRSNSNKPGYLKNMPDITLQKVEEDGMERTVMQTDDGGRFMHETGSQRSKVARHNTKGAESVVEEVPTPQ